ncbi:MAG: methyltransferase domain-containing protein [Candidatus Jordarchaeum sp.]|uniref:methyltransferase domain-containing protein n=1 Tax=Candidatus Jordarchaeum sp. TaxID=2823881 RepID=UPI004049DE2E
MILDSQRIKRNNILRHDIESEYYDEIFNIKTSYKYGSIIDSELNFADIDATKKILILDAACGTGKIALNLKAFGSKALMVGCDISSEIVKIGIEKSKKYGFSDDISWIRCDCENLPLRDDSFDLVICSSSLHHFPNFSAFMMESRRILKPRGYLAILEEPNRLGIMLIGLVGIFLTKLGEFLGRRTGSSLDQRTSEIVLKMQKNPRDLETDAYMFTINELKRAGYLAGFRRVLTKAETFFSYFVFFFMKGFFPKKYFEKIYKGAYKADSRFFHHFIPDQFRATANLYCQK